MTCSGWLSPAFDIFPRSIRISPAPDIFEMSGWRTRVGRTSTHTKKLILNAVGGRDEDKPLRISQFFREINYPRGCAIALVTMIYLQTRIWAVQRTPTGNFPVGVRWSSLQKNNSQFRYGGTMESSFERLNTSLDNVVHSNFALVLGIGWFFFQTTVQSELWTTAKGETESNDIEPIPRSFFPQITVTVSVLNLEFNDWWLNQSLHALPWQMKW